MSQGPDFQSLSRFLGETERAIRLLERCRPVNAIEETERVAGAWEDGRELAPRFEYAAPPALRAARRGLDAVATELAAESSVAGLFGERAAELDLEAALVERVGTADAARLAERRFPLGDDPFAARALADAEAFLAMTPPPPERTVLAEDRTDAESLVRIVEALVGERRLPLRVETTERLLSSAATGPGFIQVRAGIRHRPEAARRIALHEVLAHAVPRVNASRESLGLFSVGTRGSAADEEGRALVIEERAGALDVERKRELAARHLASLSLRAGADFVETTRVLVGRGVRARAAVHVAARVFRGGGLAREIVYLPSFHRVRDAFADDPSLEAWLERGRVTLAAARALRAAGVTASAPASQGASKVATTGV